MAGISLVERTLTKVAGIEQMQLIQEAKDLIVINRVRGKEYSEDTDKKIIEAVREVFGDQVNLAINDVIQISQEPSGKYRFSICRV